MSTADIFKLEYRLSRHQYGVVHSFFRAVKAAMRQPAF
jgi:hypothetical protein